MFKWFFSLFQFQNFRAISFILYRYLLLSWASQKRYRKGSAASVLIPVLGVSIGVYAFIVVLSIMGGFVNDIKQDLIRSQVHLKIESKDPMHKQLPAQKQWLDQIAKFSADVLAADPYQGGDVIVQGPGAAVMASLLGSDQNPILKNKLPAKNIENSALFPSVLMNQELMEQLGLVVGDSVTLVSTVPDDGPGGMAPLQFPVVIAGVAQDQMFYDKKTIQSSLETANTFFDTLYQWQGVRLTLKDPMRADEMAARLQQKFPKLENINLGFISWTAENKAFLKTLALEHYGMMFVLAMIILVGCFSICISLLLSVRRKSKEMAILRSMGFEHRQLSQLYLLQGMFIGCIGIAIGLVTGLITLYLIHHYELPFLSHAYASGGLPVLISKQDVTTVCFGSMFLSMLAAVWPAIEIKDLDVIEILSIRN